MLSLMDLYALRFLSTPYCLCCSLCGGSIVLKFKLTSESDSCCSYGILILNNLAFEFLNH